MAITLSSFTDRLIDATDAMLEDTVPYRADGAATYTDRQAWVEYGEALRSIETGVILDQEIRVKLSKRQVSVRPNAKCRLTLPRIAGRTYKPRNVSDIGTDWSFEVEEIERG